jgi:hypothetical protein
MVHLGSVPSDVLSWRGNGLVKLLLPLQSGYIVQSDFLERRMVDCLNVTKLQG